MEIGSSTFIKVTFIWAFERQIWNNLLISGQKLPEPVIKLWPINEKMSTLDCVHLQFVKYYHNMWSFTLEHVKKQKDCSETERNKE